MARKIVVTSGKGGVGKTSLTASIGIGLASRGNKVLLIDGDIGLNNLDVVMGMENRVVYDMADVLAGKCLLSQAILQDNYCENLYVLPSAHAYSSKCIGVKQFRQLLGKIEENFDILLIDCPAGIEDSFHRAVSGADEAIVVTTPHTSAIRDADKVLNLLGSYRLREINVVINRVRGDLVLQGKMMSGMDIAKVLRFPPLGIVPEDDSITIYSQLGRIGLNNNYSKSAFDIIADNIMTGNRRIFDPTSRYKGMWGKLKMYMEKKIL